MFGKYNFAWTLQFCRLLFVSCVCARECVCSLRVWRFIYMYLHWLIRKLHYVVFRVKFVCPTNTLTYNRFNVFLIVWLMNIFLCRDQEKGMDPNTLILKSGLLLNNYSKRFTQIWTVLSLYLIRSATIFRKRFWLNHNSVSNFRIYIDERWLSG